MKITRFGTVTDNGFDGILFTGFHFESSYKDEPITHAGIVKAICEHLNSTITDDSFKPLTDVITGKQV